MDWKNEDLRCAIKAVRNDDDEFRIPSKKDELVQLWDKLRSRSINIDPLPSSPTIQNNNNNNSTTTTVSTNYENQEKREVLGPTQFEEPLPVPHVLEDVDESGLIGLADICSNLMSERFGEAL